ncbi:MAG: hypothetical protein GY749_16350, partial [Desulfobacteraceae bacterium]|nr:hypothetical protein [Desulfobacteraceae bacterium]
MAQFKNIPVIIAPQLELRMTEWQCDACPAGILAKSDHATELTDHNYYLSPNLNTIPLTKDFKAVYAPHLAPNPLVLNKSSLKLIQHFKHPKSLDSVYINRQKVWNDKITDDALKNMIKLNLITTTEYSEPEFIESTDTLTALLHLTTSCNMACDYCYLPNNHFEMSLST